MAQNLLARNNSLTCRYSKQKHRWCFSIIRTSILVLAVVPVMVQAQQTASVTPQSLKKLSLEELMDVEVISVSKTPEKLTEVASAIQVITGDDIHRSAATRLPEALRLATNLQVAQSNSHDWAITARGFNGIPLTGSNLANKLLIMVDGRSIYTPLFGGVFWDVQNVLLEDIDRIEVVSGPGGTLWGVNAINGVINILSKNAKETQGLYATGAVGSFMQDHGAVRYGGQAGSRVFYRVYGQFYDQRSTRIFDTIDGQDKWNQVQGGFRVDYDATDKDLVTIQGDLYFGKENTLLTTSTNGQNVLGRWTHRFSDTSSLSLQFYFDRTWRFLSYNGFGDELKTYDLDFQHRFALGKVQKVTYGGNLRVMDDSVRANTSLSIRPTRKILLLVSGFVQDQIMIVRNKLELTVGTKLTHNTYTNFEIQPSARLAYTPNTHHTIWAAVSRAVRIPSRFDVDETSASVSTPAGTFRSEKVLAYELGYRVKPIDRISLSFSGFFNQYTDVRSLNANPAGPTPLIFANSQTARTWGLEFFGHFAILDKWRIRAGYTYLGKKFRTLNGRVIPGADLFEGIDPTHQAMIQSIVDLPQNIQLDIIGRYADTIPLAPPLRVNAYVTVDVRLAWKYKKFEFAIVGQNLVATRHQEFGLYQVPRSVYGRVTCRLY